MSHSLLAKPLPLSDKDHAELLELLKTKPVLERWFQHIEQDVLDEVVGAPPLWDDSPDTVKAKQSYTAGKLEIINTLAKAVEIAQGVELPRI